jgi:cell division protein FtsZ
LRQGVQAITDIITQSGLINVDFADVKTVMANRGMAHMGVGYGKGESRVEDAVKAAIENPLLETSIDGAQAILLNVTGGYDLSLLDVNAAAEQIEQAADKNVILIFGTAVYEEMSDEINVTVIATGFEGRDVERMDVQAPPVQAPASSAGLERPAEDGAGSAIGFDPAFESDSEEYDEAGSIGFIDRNAEPDQEPIDLYGVDGGGENDFTVPEFLKRD